MQPHRDLVVVGASAGGLPALQTILGDLPAELPIAILVVVHSSPDSPGHLVDVLNRRSLYVASYARDREEIAYGRVYVAPPDHHLTTNDGRLSLTRGPRENRFRPAVDPLFRSAAASHGARVIGVVLSGSLDDGTHGLALVKRHGGVAIVQSAEDALVPHMPASAARAVAADHVVPAAQMAMLIARLVGKPQRVARRHGRTAPGRKSAAAKDPPPPDDPRDTPTVLTCPDCGGALWELKDHNVLRYRCHVGHGLTGETLARAQMDRIEESLWRAVRALEEHAELRRRMALRARMAQLGTLARSWDTQADDSERRADDIRRALRDGVPGADDHGAHLAPPLARRAGR
jgi:two-component system chemotaxis response regulator CheB